MRYARTRTLGNISRCSRSVRNAPWSQDFRAPRTLREQSGLAGKFGGRIHNETMLCDKSNRRGRVEVREHADDVFDFIIIPAMKELGIEAYRSDHRHRGRQDQRPDVPFDPA